MISVLLSLSTNIMVMYLGQVVELADSKKLFKNPVHPYTKTLLSAIPIPDPDIKMNRIVCRGEITFSYQCP